jgi:glycogen debranching enzyme
VVHPEGYLNLIEFRLDPFPCFTYAQDDWQLKKSVFMVHGENSTVVEYRFTSINSSRLWGDGQNLPREALLIAGHESYHTGELIVTRRLLGEWKPKKGHA